MNRMTFDRVRWSWYDIIIVGISAVIVYPDRILDLIGECTGRTFGWRHIMMFEAVAITLIVVAMGLLMPAYPRLPWWYPLPIIGILALFRVATWFIDQM